MAKIWITGTNRGLGLKLASKFKDARHTVKAINRERIDLSHPPEDVHAMFKDLLFEEEEPPDVFIHNAGVTLHRMADKETDLHETEHVMRVNCMSRVAINAALINSDKTKAIRIIHVGSVASTVMMRSAQAYCMSKAADEMQVKQLAWEASKFYPHVTVIGVAPNAIENTDMQKQAFEGLVDKGGMSVQDAESALIRSPMGRQSTLNEVFDVVSWVALEAPVYMSGAIIKMPGGMLL